MKNWKTLVAGLVLAVLMQGEALGIPPKLSQALQGVAVAVMGLMAKDHDVTGGTKMQ